MFYFIKGHSKRDSDDLTPPEAVWVADAFLLLFVIDHISEGIRLLLICAEAEAMLKAGDVF